MPKVKYTPREGLVITRGTGFVVAGGGIKEPVETITPGSGGTATLRSYGATSIDTTGGASGNLTLPDGVAVGALKKIVLTTDGGDATVKVTNHVDGSNRTFVGADADDLLVLVWNGTKWDSVIEGGWSAS